jgi:DNA-binding SARP family transcriptional activator
LRQALLELRRSINVSRDIIRSDREHIWIEADSLIEDAADENGHHREAFQDLDGITPEFDEWLAAERLRRSKLRSAALKAEAEELLREGRALDALTVIEHMQTIDPHDEDALCLAMKAEFARAHPAAIAERYRATAALLHAHLGVEPAQETRALRDRLIRALTASRQQDQQPETDQDYFSRRAREELGAAAKAETSASRDIHEALSNQYELRAAALSGTRDDPGAHEQRTVEGHRFLRKSMIIHAVRWFKHGDHPAVVPGSVEDPSAYVETPEGRLRVNPGDWIITGISGEHYPCKHEVFEQLYVTVD